MLAWPYGSIKLMSSYYFTNTDAGPPSVGVDNGAHCGDGSNWVCEHRWPLIANMIAWRNAVNSASVSNWQEGSGGNQIAFSRGGAGFVAFNRAGSSSWSATLQTGLPAGQYCNVLASYDADKVGTCSTVTVNADGTASINVPSMSAVALHIKAKK